MVERGTHKPKVGGSIPPAAIDSVGMASVIATESNTLIVGSNRSRRAKIQVDATNGRVDILRGGGWPTGAPQF